MFWQPENVTTQGYVAKLIDFTQQQENTKLLQNFNNNEPVPNYTEGVITSSYPENSPPNQQDKGDYGPLPHQEGYPPPYWGYPPPPWWRRHPSYYHFYWDYYRRPPPLPGNQDERRSTEGRWNYNQNNTNSLYDRGSADQGNPQPPPWDPPPYRRWGPPPYGFWGPPPYRRWGPPPYGRWGPPPYGRWGSPPYGRWSPPPYGPWGPPPYRRWGPPPPHHDWDPPSRRHGWGAPPPQENWGSPPYNQSLSPYQRPQPDDNQQPTKLPYDNSQIHNRLFEQSDENPNYDNYDNTRNSAPLNDIRNKNSPGHGVPLLNDERMIERRPEATTQSLSHLYQAMPVTPES